MLFLVQLRPFHNVKAATIYDHIQAILLSAGRGANFGNAPAGPIQRYEYTTYVVAGLLEQPTNGNQNACDTRITGVFTASE